MEQEHPKKEGEGSLITDDGNPLVPEDGNRLIPEDKPERTGDKPEDPSE
jgi:hypothetical protein